MNAVFLSARYLLALCCALAFLYAASFPHSIVAPDPGLEAFAPKWSLYGLRHCLFVLPLLLWEFVCLLGPRRNLIWFSSLLTTIILTLLAWPVLDALYPELLRPTFSYEDGRLSLGLAYLAVLLVFSLFFRLLILNYFFALPAEPYEGNDIGLMELDISKAKTVQAIAAEGPKALPRFRFGGPDRGLIARFYERARALLRMRRAHQLWLVAAIVAGVAWFFGAPLFLSSPQQAMARDWARMYEYTRAPKSAPRATTPAVYAAYRVFEKLSAEEALAGMNIAEAEDFLRLSGVQSSDYKKILRSESNLSQGSDEDIFASRTRFLTVSDGQKRVILYVRLNEDGTRINICEVQDDGWNAIIDQERRRMGSDWRSNVLSR